MRQQLFNVIGRTATLYIWWYVTPLRSYAQYPTGNMTMLLVLIYQFLLLIHVHTHIIEVIFIVLYRPCNASWFLKIAQCIGLVETEKLNAPANTFGPVTWIRVFTHCLLNLLTQDIDCNHHYFIIEPEHQHSLSYHEYPNPGVHQALLTEVCFTAHCGRNYIAQYYNKFISINIRCFGILIKMLQEFTWGHV